jgi:hypothetical protein
MSCPYTESEIAMAYVKFRGLNSSVGRARAGRSGDEIPLWCAIFRTRPDWYWSSPAFYTKGTGSFLGVKRPGRGVDHTPRLVPRFEKE